MTRWSLVSFALALFLLALGVSPSASMLSADNRPASQDRFAESASGESSTEEKGPSAQTLQIANLALPEAQAYEHYATELHAVGGSPPYLWSLQGALPPGTAFVPTYGRIRGTPRQSGSWRLFVSVVDAAGAQAGRFLDFVVAEGRLRIDEEMLPTGRVGQFYSVYLTGLGGQGSYRWQATGDLPAGLRLYPNTGRIRGTPVSAGFSDFTVTVTDASGGGNSVTKDLTLFVADDLIQVSDAGSLQSALGSVEDGQMIELEAGIYPAPPGGFSHQNRHREFAIRAAPGASVRLDGGGDTPIFKLRNTDGDTRGRVLFQGLSFENGGGAENTIGTGVTVRDASAIFEDCLFRENHGDPQVANFRVGGLKLSGGTRVSVIRSRFENNSAVGPGGAIKINQTGEGGAEVRVIDSEFFANRATLRATGAGESSNGGAIYLEGGLLVVRDSYFEDNHCEFVGGAIMARGIYDDEDYTEPVATVRVSNSSFYGNGCTTNGVVSGTPSSAIHGEGDVLLVIDDSLFVENRSEGTGAVSGYRSTGVIQRSEFLGNGNLPGFSHTVGTIHFGGNDANNASTGFGEFNRPSAHLTVRDSYFVGRYGDTDVVSGSAGAIHVSGDKQREFLGHTVPVDPGPEEYWNYGTAVLENVIIEDVDVRQLNPEAASAAGVRFSLALATLDGVEIRDCDVLESGTGQAGRGGGMVAWILSEVSVRDSVIERCSAISSGGGLYSFGSTLVFEDSEIVDNFLVDADGSGTQIYHRPDRSPLRLSDAQGVFRDNLIRGPGRVIAEGDYSDGPINHVRYDGNQIESTDASTWIYWNDLLIDGLDVDGLNSVTILRDPGVDTTEKSQVDNSSD